MTLLKQRIDKAIEVYNSSNPNIKIICVVQGSMRKFLKPKPWQLYCIQYGRSMSRVLRKKNLLRHMRICYFQKKSRRVSDKPKFLPATTTIMCMWTSAYARKIKRTEYLFRCRTAGYYIPSAIRAYRRLRKDWMVRKHSMLYYLSVLAIG